MILKSGLESEAIKDSLEQSQEFNIDERLLDSDSPVGR
jgi:hypothetical protein